MAKDKCLAGGKPSLCSHVFAGRGVGSEVVRRAFDLARAVVCRVIRLDTGGQDLPAVGLCTKLGFPCTGGGSFLPDGRLPAPARMSPEYLL